MLLFVEYVFAILFILSKINCGSDGLITQSEVPSPEVSKILVFFISLYFLFNDSRLYSSRF